MKYLPKTLVDVPGPGSLLSRRQLRQRLAELHNAAQPGKARLVGGQWHDAACKCKRCKETRRVWRPAGAVREAEHE